MDVETPIQRNAIQHRRRWAWILRPSGPGRRYNASIGLDALLPSCTDLKYGSDCSAA
jgi:hypothetical protein